MYERSMLLLMAERNHWMNKKIYHVCAHMPDEERKCNHGIFNHLLLVDRLCGYE